VINKELSVAEGAIFFQRSRATPAPLESLRYLGVWGDAGAQRLRMRRVGVLPGPGELIGHEAALHTTPRSSL